MKLKLIAVASLLSVTAHAGIMADSSEGSLGVANGALGSVMTTLSVVKGSLADSKDSTVKHAVSSYQKAKKGVSVFIHAPFETSAKGLKESGDSASYVVSKTGEVLKCSVVEVADSLDALIEDPSGTVIESGKMVAAKIEASGAVLVKSATGSYQKLKNTYGEDVELVLTGSGDIYKASKSSIIVAVRKTKEAANSTVTFVNDHSVDPVVGSAKEGIELVKYLARSAENIFKSGVKSDRQY